MASAQDVHATLEAIREERGKGRTIRLVTTGVLVLSVGLFIGSTYSKVTNFDVDATVVALQSHGQRTVAPVYEKHLKAVGEDAVAALSEAVQAEAEALLPRVSDRLTAEAETFQNNLGQHMKDSLERDLRAALEGRKAEFEKRFPDFTANDEVYESFLVKLQVASQQWAQDQLDTTFAEHVALLESINNTVSSLRDTPKANQGVADGTAPTMEDVLVLMAEILNTRVGGE